MTQEEYYLNQLQSSCIKLPRKDTKYLRNDNYLSEFELDVEKAEARSNLGIPPLLEQLKALIDTKVIKIGGIAWDLEPTEGNTENVLSSDAIYNTLLKYYDKTEVDEKITLLYKTFVEMSVDEEIADSPNPVQNSAIKYALDTLNGKIDNIYGDLIETINSDRKYLEEKEIADVTNLQKLIDLINPESGLVDEILSDIAEIQGTLEDYLPEDVSVENKLADLNYVNLKIAVADATFKGTFTSTQDLWKVTADENDYAYVIVVQDNNTIYNRYKWSNGWQYEFSIDRDSFTAELWDAINSGINSEDKTKLTNLPSNSVLQETLKAKQDKLTDKVKLKNNNNESVTFRIKDEVSINNERIAQITTENELELKSATKIGLKSDIVNIGNHSWNDKQGLVNVGSSANLVNVGSSANLVNVGSSAELVNVGYKSDGNTESGILIRKSENAETVRIAGQRVELSSKKRRGNETIIYSNNFIFKPTDKNTFTIRADDNSIKLRVLSNNFIELNEDDTRFIYSDLDNFIFKKGGDTANTFTLKDLGIKVNPTTYTNLVTLVTKKLLYPGNYYMITDYETTTTQTGTQSAGHKFNIIVLALTTNTLSENALAIKNDDSYFDYSNVTGWKVKYSIKNDTTKFAWADRTNGKGVIYYMQDEFGNECYYDFKNIQFLDNGTYKYTFDYNGNDRSMNGEFDTTEPIQCYNNKIEAYYEKVSS